jgi:hypothetical protein
VKLADSKHEDATGLSVLGTVTWGLKILATGPIGLGVFAASEIFSLASIANSIGRNIETDKAIVAVVSTRDGSSN